MHNSKLKKLERVVNRGIVKFVLIYGVLGWGVTTAILFSILQHFAGVPQTTSTVTRALIIFSVGGIFWGLLMWWFLKWQYGKSKRAIK